MSNYECMCNSRSRSNKCSVRACHTSGMKKKRNDMPNNHRLEAAIDALYVCYTADMKKRKNKTS